MNHQVNNDELGRPSTEKGEKKNKKSGKLLIALLAVLILAASGLSAVYYFSQKSEAEENAKRQTEITSQPFEFTVNLADTAKRCYLKVTVELGYYNKRLTNELKKREPEIRDAIIAILRSHRSDQLLTVEGTDKARVEIRNELSSRLTEGELKDVYFTQFLIQ